MHAVKGQKAFSLIEVMVIVAILAIVIMVAFRQFGGDLGKARDAQRKEDLKQLKLAFENYYNDRGSYPPVDYLSDCGGPSLQPYLKEVPCDPVTGDPYLYLPDMMSGESVHAYRILSFLSNVQDPIVAQLGCQSGCGIPEDHPSYPDGIKYVYGVAEGVPLVLADYVPFMPGNEDGLPSDPDLDCSPGSGTTCYCCGGVGHGCNVYNGPAYGSCFAGPFTSLMSCYTNTVCVPPP